MKRVYASILVTALMFGSMEVALTISGPVIDTFQMTFLRFGIAGLMILPFGISEMRKKKIRLTAGDHLYLVLLGFVGVAVSMIAFQLGVLASNASTAAVLFCINPLFTMLFAHFMLREEMSLEKVLIIVLGLIGIFFMVKPWDIQEGNTVAGFIYIIFAALTFGLYTAMAKKSIAKMGTFAQTSISFIYGSAMVLIATIIMHRPVFAGVLENWMIVAYCGFFVTGLGYFCYFIAIRYSDAVTGSMSFFIKPAIAPIIAVIVLGETIEWSTVAGIVFILAASYINMRNNRKALHGNN